MVIIHLETEQSSTQVTLHARRFIGVHPDSGCTPVAQLGLHFMCYVHQSIERIKGTNTIEEKKLQKKKQRAKRETDAQSNEGTSCTARLQNIRVRYTYRVGGENIYERGEAKQGAKRCNMSLLRVKLAV
ncbi:hypothetical protein QAD02_015456 [Eretmocerus hayati]|uniref:Uncharacterized protein n=1 Tax=Eretmocerus hayati TaxID=131215 RepID=A0ACC2PAR4_9HYME|nr:hypothetical protein QAD02_015456 [Eretmocerus hayati]